MSNIAYYISSSTGSDSNAGTSAAAPWKTLAKLTAASLLAAPSVILFKGGDVISVFNGSAGTPTPLSIPWNGSIASPIVVGSYGHGNATLSGGIQLTGWQLSNASAGIYAAPYNTSIGNGIPRVLEYSSGGTAPQIRCSRASTPIPVNWANANLSGSTVTTTGYNTSGASPAGYMSGWTNAATGDIELICRNIAAWSESRHPCQVSGNIITVPTAAWANQVARKNAAGGALTITAIENSYEIFIANLAPASFYVNRSSGTIYLIPPTGTLPPQLSTVFAGVAETIVSQNNSTGLLFTGINFSHTSCYQPSNADGFAEVQVNTYLIGGNGNPTNGVVPKPNAALHFANCTNVSINRCTLAGLGTPGFTIDGTSLNCDVAGNIIDDLSSVAYYIGDPSQILAANAPNGVKVHSNVITRLGVEFRGASAGHGFYGQNCVVNYNLMAYGPYSGPTWGWGWTNAGTQTNANNLTIGSQGQNKIQENIIHDFLQQMSDGGGVDLNGNNSTGVTDNLIYNLGNNGYNCVGIGGLYFDNGTNGAVGYRNVIYNMIPPNASQGAAQGTNIVGILCNSGVNNCTFAGTTMDAITTAQNQGGSATLTYNAGGNVNNSIAVPATVGLLGAIAAGQALIAAGTGLEPAYADLLTNFPGPTLREQLIAALIKTSAVPAIHFPLNEPFGSATVTDIAGGLIGTPNAAVVLGTLGSLSPDPAFGAKSNDSTGVIEIPPAGIMSMGATWTLGFFFRFTGHPTYTELVFNNSDYWPAGSGSNYWFAFCDTYGSGTRSVGMTIRGNSSFQPVSCDGLEHFACIVAASGIITTYIDGAIGAGNVTCGYSGTVGQTTKKSGILNQSTQYGQNSGGAMTSAINNFFLLNGYAASPAQMKIIAASLNQSAPELSQPPLNTVPLFASQVASGAVFGPGLDNATTGSAAGGGGSHPGSTQLSRSR